MLNCVIYLKVVFKILFGLLVVRWFKASNVLGSVPPTSTAQAQGRSGSLLQRSDPRTGKEVRESEISVAV